MKEKIKLLFNKFKYGVLATALCAFVLVFDLMTKALNEGENYSIIKGVLSCFSSHNTGGAWSILSSATWILIVLSIIFLLIIVAANWMFKEKNIMYTVAIGLIMGGAIGNLFDRIFLGYVRDFISLDFMHFPIFNFADVAICAGVITLCVFFLISYFKNKKQEAQKQNEVGEN